MNANVSSNVSQGMMMRQIQEMQQRMSAMQERLASMEFSGQAGNGAVTISINGKGEMKKVKLDPKQIDFGEIEMLEDMIVAAYNAAKAKADAEIVKETQKMMGNIKLPPGVTLPTG